METTYKRSMHKSYMCITEREGLSEEYERKILKGQRIPHLLKMQAIFVDGQESYLYEISGKQQIEDYLSGRKINDAMLRKFLFAVERLCSTMSEYLLREDGVCLEPEYIYINLEDEEVYFAYLPFRRKSLRESFECCLEWMLRKIDHKDQDAAELGYYVYQMCSGENVSIKDMLESARKRTGQEESNEREAEEPILCRESKKQEEDETQEEKKHIWEESLCKVQEWALNQPVYQAVLSYRNRENKSKREGKCSRIKWFKKNSKGKGARAAGRREEIQEEKEKITWQKESFYEEVRKKEKLAVRPTEVLSAGKQGPVGKLTYQGIHGCGDIWIEGETFLLGKSRQQAEGIIEAEGVSRLHARISRQGEQYYLEDLNSTNGTYLNEIPLEYRQKKELCKNDCVRFGAEEYVFS